ncbi:MAG: pyruvate kinase [Alphaproteobacteria bacterium]|nr:pyruvate kinase [Alphaproteobacteria bacterium]
MNHISYTKIVATLGPASSSKKVLLSLIDAGVDVFRLNFSHGTHESHQESCRIIREIEKEKNCSIGILADLQGPKLRVGCFANGHVILKAGQEFQLDLSEELGDEKRVSLLHPEIFSVLEDGSTILINDGRIRLRVLDGSKEHARTEVITGGKISNNKGVNVPDVSLPISALTAKDKYDLQAALKIGVDCIALSFVQRPEDIKELREIVGQETWIMAKLEKPGAIKHLEEIIDLSDAVMVARGDLGVELPPETVPILQKRIINACRAVGKPVVVATQMLETMIEEPTPTRAEASDVATAVFDGADAVMLSAETAVGAYPIEAVRMMDSIINHVEEDSLYFRLMDASRNNPESTPEDAITAAARQVAHTLDAAAIVTYTLSGSTTMRAARERPYRTILCLTPKKEVARRMCLVWGVESMVGPTIVDFMDIEVQAKQFAIEKGIVKNGEKLVITAGMPFGQAGSTNILRIVGLD